MSGTSVDGVKIAEEALSFFGTCGLVRGVEYLLDNGFVGANDKDSEGITPLQHAVASGKLEWVGVLLEKGADVNGTDNRGFTPLHYAAGEGHVKCLRVLVEKGAKVNVVSEGSMLPLHCAADSGSEECLNELLELDASLVDEAAGEALLTPLHYAAMRNHTGCANILMNIKDMGLNIKDIYGETAVHIASTADNTSCLDALLARPGIEVNLENNVGETALFKAVKHNRTGCIESLLGTGDIQKNALNNEGVGALFCAIRYMDSPEDFKKFLDTAGLKLDVRDRRGNTPIHYAILHSLDNLKVLLGVEGVRAQVNEKNSDGDTALHCAIKEEDGIEGYIQALCGACAQELDVEVMDNNGYTPLECLEKYGDYYETCKKQLQDKAQIQAQAQ